MKRRVLRVIGGVCAGLLATEVLGCAPVILEKDRAAAKVHFDIAVSSMQNNDMRGALRDLLAAAQKDPELPQAHNGLGLVYHALGRLEDSLEHYREAVRLKPDFSDCYNNLGVLYIELGRYDEAIDSFQKALGDILYPTPSMAEGNLGWAYYKKGDTPQALKHLRNAVATNPKFCRGYEWLARIGLETDAAGETVAQVKRFQKYCVEDAAVKKSLPPGYVAELTYYLALAYLKQGDRPGARAAFGECATAGDIGVGPKCSAALAGLP